MPPQHMIEKAPMGDELFDSDNKLIPSQKSKMVTGVENGHHSLRNVLLNSGERDEVFIDFIESCLRIDPVERMTP